MKQMKILFKCVVNSAERQLNWWRTYPNFETMMVQGRFASVVKTGRKPPTIAQYVLMIGRGLCHKEKCRRLNPYIKNLLCSWSYLYYSTLWYFVRLTNLMLSLTIFQIFFNIQIEIEENLHSNINHQIQQTFAVLNNGKNERESFLSHFS